MPVRDKYNKHIFVCINSRTGESSRRSCGNIGHLIRQKMVEKLKEYDCVELSVRVNKAGCLNKCELGPAIVIYPQGFWYYNVGLEDVDEIVEESILKDNYIERLS